MKVKSESEVAQSSPTLLDPMDCSLPGSSAHGIFQARLLEWGAIVFSLMPRIGQKLSEMDAKSSTFLYTDAKSNARDRVSVEGEKRVAFIVWPGNGGYSGFLPRKSYVCLLGEDSEKFYHNEGRNRQNRICLESRNPSWAGLWI